GGFCVAEVIAVELHEEGGVRLKGAVESIGLTVYFLAIDPDALRERIAWIGMVSFEFDVAANTAGNVDRPEVWSGRDFLPGVEQDLLAGGFVKILKVDT